MNNRTQLARRYAKAFVNIFAESLDVATITRLSLLLQLLKKNKLARFALRLSVLTQNEQAYIVDRLFEYHEIDPIFKKLRALLVRDGRVYLLEDVLQYIQQLYADYLGIHACTIESSHILTEQQITTLVKFAQQKTGKKLVYDLKIDPALITGIALRGQTFYWEYSVRRQLQCLKEPLIRKGYYERY